MLQQIRKKLNKNNGASILIALGLFLICTMVASLIIVAAASGSNRSTLRINQQRAYFAVSSAAEMLVEDLQTQGEFVGKNQATRYGCKEYYTPTKYSLQKTNGQIAYGYLIPATLINESSSPIIIDELHLTNDLEVKSVDEANTHLNGLLGGVIKKAAEKVYKENSPYEEHFIIKADDSSDRLPNVNCKFSMDTSYNIKIELKAEDSEYSVTINTKCASAGLAVESVPNGKCNHIVLYKEKQDDGSFLDAQMTLGIGISYNLETTTVRWGVPEIVKGVAP